MAKTDITRKSWSAAEDRQLIRLWNEGIPIDDIGALFGRTYGSVQTRATRLNLGQHPKRYGKITASGQRPWSATEDATLAELRKQYFTLEQIGKRLGRSASSVHGRLSVLRKKVDASAAAQKRTRECMRCGSPFMSDGPGNRHCNPCRDWLCEAA